MSVKGIDISSNNGAKIDFKQMYASGIRFVLIKVTEGVKYTNPYAARHAKEAKAAGLIVGGYAFLRPDHGHTPQAEANYFFDQAHHCGLLEKGCLRPTVDIEVTALPKGLPSRRYDYAVIEQLIKRMGPNGKKPFIYTGSWFWDGVLGARNAHKCPLWLAAYTKSWRKLIPKGWHGVAIHQETDSGVIRGISGKFDVDRYLGTDVRMLHAHHCLTANH